eukprot:1406222-Prymnesium_polylepis.1
MPCVCMAYTVQPGMCIVISKVPPQQRVHGLWLMRNSRIPSALASLTKPHQTHADSSTDSIRPDALAGLWLILEVLSLTRVSLCLVGSLKLEPADDGALNEMSERGF